MAMRATHQIVLANAAQALAEVATLVAAIRADARRVDRPVAPPVDLMVRAPVPEQIDHDETVRRRIAQDETATAPIRRVPHGMGTAHIQLGQPAMAILVHVATVMLDLRAPAETGPIRLVPRGTVIRVHPEAMVIDHTLREQPAMATPGHVGMAIALILRDLHVMVTNLTRRAHLAMVTPFHVSPAATARVLVDRRAPVATVPIRLVRRVMAIRVRAAIATALAALRALAETDPIRLVLLVMGTGLALTVLALTVRGAIARMGTGRAGIGNPRAVSVVRSVRR